MRKNLLEFLFGTAAVRESQTLGEDVVRLFEEAADEETEQMVADKKPLAAALKSIGIDHAVVVGPQGAELFCDDEADYREYCAKLRDPDGMAKLAEKGWVASLCGDQAMSNEPASFKIGFVEIYTPEPDDKDKAPDLEKIIKDGQKFAATEPEHDDKMNPVEFDDKGSKDGQKGVGDPKDGAAPEGKPKGSTKKTESLIHEYGGYFCGKCKKPTQGKVTEGKRCCEHCGNALPAKSSSLRSKEMKSAKNVAESLLETTMASAVPALEAPMGAPARRINYRKRLQAMRKRRGENEHGNPTG